MAKRFLPSEIYPMGNLWAIVITSLHVLILGGCGGGGGSSSEDLSAESRAAVAGEIRQTPYQFANQCYAVELADGFIAIDGVSSGYSLTDSQEAAARFYLKASDLARYLLFDQHAYLLAAHDDVVRTQELDMRLQWELQQRGDRSFVLFATATQQWLTTNGAGLELVTDPASATEVRFHQAEGCQPYPEAELNAVGEPTKAEFADGAVWGIADAHAHLFGTLAFGGNVMVGDVFHPLGLPKALEDCSNQHGIGGKLDITGFVTHEEYGNEGKRAARLPLMLLLNQALHDTTGYPEFTEWPNNQSTTHQIAYYKWLERAYLGGLRLMVNLLVESGPLCKVGRELSRKYSPTDDNYEFNDDVVCNGEETSQRQLRATNKLVDYIDAQHGGPGKGWLRVVTSPAEARRVIKQGKLAMIMGSETPDLFKCIDGVEGGREECGYEYIEQRLDEYLARGINGIFPVHHYNNDFGGARVFNSLIEVASVLQDGALFHYEVCGGDYDPLLAIKIPGVYYLLFPNFMRDLPLFPFVPEGDGYCNRRGLTDLGAHLVREMMKRGMLIETAHMSANMKAAVVDMAEYYDYPLIDSHWGKAFDDALKPEEARYLSLGGVRAPLFNRHASVAEYRGVKKNCETHTSQDMAIQLMAFSDVRSELGIDPGVVFGTDMHGMVQQAYPRFGRKARCHQPQENRLQYPFQSFDGAVEFAKQVSGNRVFDYNTDGLAHIGLLPDAIQDMRNQGMSDHYIEMFFRGAESYLQMWEKAQSRADNWRD